MEAAASVPHDRSRYEGKNLLRLLLAFFGPALLLFLKIVVSIAEAGNRVTAREMLWMNRASYAVLAIFLLVSLLCARYVQRLLPLARTRIIDVLQYAGVLVLCLFTSYCGAVVCEAFGYEVFIRLAQQR